MTSRTATVSRTTAPFNSVVGEFFRAVDPAFRTHVLAGSRTNGRFSSAEQPTLYLSATPDGVEAAMVAHAEQRAKELPIVTLHVTAERILDLRDVDACAHAQIAIEDAAAPWQPRLAAGAQPSSWRVRAQVEALGGYGLIDPSRKAPGLWHLVLFKWNVEGAPIVVARD